MIRCPLTVARNPNYILHIAAFVTMDNGILSLPQKSSPKWADSYGIHKQELALIWYYGGEAHKHAAAEIDCCALQDVGQNA